MNALNDIVRTGAREVVVVTSRWHAARAKAAFRLLLWKKHVRVSAAFPPEPRSTVAMMRELALWVVLPVQLWHARRFRARTTG